MTQPRQPRTKHQPQISVSDWLDLFATIRAMSQLKRGTKAYEDTKKSLLCNPEWIKSVYLSKQD